MTDTSKKRGKSGRNDLIINGVVVKGQIVDSRYDKGGLWTIKMLDGSIIYATGAVMMVVPGQEQ